MTFPDFKFYLIEEDTTIHELAYAPAGWEDMEVRIARSQGYHGIFRSLALDIRFVKDGASLVRQKMIDSGTEAILWFSIYERQNNFTYTEFYQGSLDFSTFKDLGDFVEISILDGGIAEQIKAKEDVVFEIPLDDSYEVKVNYRGVTMTDRAIYGNEALSLSDNYAFQKHIPAYLSEFNDATGGAVQMTDQLSAGGSYFIYALRSCKVRFSIDLIFDFDWSAITDLTLQIGIGRVGVGTLAAVLFEETFPSGSGTEYRRALETSAEIELVAGEYYELIAQTDVDGVVEIAFSKIYMRVDIMAQLPEVQFKAKSAQMVFENLIEKICPGVAYQFGEMTSDGFFHIMMTSGDAIRGLDNPVLKISLKDYFAFLNAKFCVGLGVFVDDVTPTILLDIRESFYEMTQLYSIGEVRDMSYSPAKDHQFSHIKIGTKSQEDLDENNGKDEPNTTFEWVTPLTRNPNTLEMVSPYRDDMYGIDMHRLKYINAADDKKSGAKDDNPVFVLSCEDDVIPGEYIPERDHYTIDEGLFYPDTAINIRLTPGRCLRNAGGYLHAGLTGFDSSDLTFASCSKNKTLKSESTEGITVVEIDEDDLVKISTLGRALFYPYYFEFTAPVPADFFGVFQKYPYRYVSFTFKGYAFAGFIVEMKINPTSREATGWKLLSTNGVTLQNLVDSHEDF